MPNSWLSVKLSNTSKAALLLLLFALIIYSNSLGGEFLYDDDYFVVKNVHIKDLKNIPSFFVNPTAVAFSELSQDVYRPITAASYAFDYHFYRLNTFGYHLENVLFHGINAILIFILLQLILGDIFVSFLSSVFFICHPVQTEVVAWISGRASVLFLLFYLASFISYVLYDRRNKKIFFALSLILFFKSLFSKEMAVSLPVLLTIYEIHFGMKESLKRKAMKLAPYFVLAAFFVIVRFLVINRVSQTGWWGGNPYYTFLTMIVAIGDYIKLLLVPVKLCAFYVPTICKSILIPKVFITLLALVAVMFSLPFIFKRSRRVSFAICLFFVTLLPVSNIVPLRAIMAERFLYLPSIGFCILASVALERLRSSSLFFNKKFMQYLMLLAAVLLIFFYSIRTMLRNEDWKTARGVTSSILKIDPLNPWALMSLGVSYSAQERYADAIEPLIKSIALSNEYFAPRNVLGFCYLQLGRYDDAIKILTEALKIKPDNLEALSSLGVALAELKRYPEAIGQFEHAVKVDPSFIDGYLNLATAYEHMGQLEKAIEVYKRALIAARSSDSFVIIYIRMGDIYVKLQDLVTAEAYYNKGIDLCNPKMEELKKIIMTRLNMLQSKK